MASSGIGGGGLIQMARDISSVWKPQLGPQLFATICPARIILFGGSRGGGKTDCAIGRQIYGAIEHGYKWNGLFIRKSYKYFGELRRRIFELIRFGLPAELKGGDKGTNYLKFHNGAIVTLTVVESLDKAEFLQGQQFTEISIEEACQFPFIDQLIEMAKGCLRSPHGLTCRMFLTANPGGPGHNQVKSMFMPVGSRPGQVLLDDAGMSRVFIPSSVNDNKILCENDPEYVATLRSIKDPMLRRAWLEGDWDVVLGGFFSDVWNKFIHVVPYFRPPAFWPRIVGMDWGSSTPFSIGWYAVSDGETSIRECSNRIFPRGALIRFSEWYGCPKGEANVGLRMSSTAVAEGILSRESRRELLGRGAPVDRVADPSIFAEKDGPSIAEKMSQAGVVWRKAENRRLSGWDTLRGMLRGRLVSRQVVPVRMPDGTVEMQVVSEKWEPMFYVTENCKEFERTLPQQQRDEVDWEDVDTDGEDHIADEARYVAMSRPSKGVSYTGTIGKEQLHGCAADIAEAVAGGRRGAVDPEMLPVSAGGGTDGLVGTNVYFAR